MNDVRRKTNDLIQAVEDGFLSWEEVARACLCYMSEDDVADMCKANDFEIADDDELEDEEYTLMVIYRGEDLPDCVGNFNSIEEAKSAVCSDIDVAHYIVMNKDGNIVEEDDWDDFEF